MRCPECNQEVDIQDKFCGSCGYSLNAMNTEKESLEKFTENSSEESKENLKNAKENLPQKQTVSEAEAPLPKKRNRKAVGVGVALAVAVCVLVAVLFFVFSKGDSGKETAAVENSPKPTEQALETEQPKEEETPTPTPDDTPYWQKFFEEGSNTLTEQQWKEAYLLFRKAWSYYGDSDYEVSVDMDEIDLQQPKNSDSIYMPHEIAVDQNGDIDILVHMVHANVYDDISVVPYRLKYQMSANSPYEHFSLESYQKEEERVTTSYQKVTASSVLAPQKSNGVKVKFNPSNLVDNDTDTAWMEGVSGYGIGSWIKVSASQSYDIYGIAIRNGYNKSDKHYTVNARPKKVKFTFDGNKSHTATLSANRSYNGEYTDIIMFDTAIPSDYVKMTIQSVYQGEDYFSYYDEEDAKKCKDTGFDEIYVIH